MSNSIKSYMSRRWLNNDDSNYTGYVMVYHGKPQYREAKEDDIDIFIEIADCSRRIRLHDNPTQTKQHFIEKVDVLIEELTKFKFFLKDHYGC